MKGVDYKGGFTEYLPDFRFQAAKEGREATAEEIRLSSRPVTVVSWQALTQVKKLYQNRNGAPPCVHCHDKLLKEETSPTPARLRELQIRAAAHMFAAGYTSAPRRYVDFNGLGFIWSQVYKCNSKTGGCGGAVSADAHEAAAAASLCYSRSSRQ